MATMTKEDLQNMINDVVEDKVGKGLEDVKQESQSKIQDMFEEKKEVAKEKQMGKGEKAARFLRAIAVGKGDIDTSAKIVHDKWGDEAFSKQLLQSEYDAGGVLVPDEYVADIIDLLRAQSTVRAMGAQTMPMSGSLTIPKLTQGSTSEYIGENQRGGASQPEFGSIQLSEKKLKTLVPISNDLLRNSSPAADTIVRDDIVNAMALKEDIAFIRYDGTEDKPKGMYHWADDDNIFNAGDISSDELETVTNDLTKAIYKLAGSDVPMANPGWIFSPRTTYYLMKLRDGNGNYVYREELQNGTLMGFPFADTTQIPINLGGSNDETEIYFADFAQLIIAESMDLIIDVSSEASYYDGENNVSAFDNDLTLIRALSKHDFGARHEEAIAVIEECDWDFD